MLTGKAIQCKISIESKNTLWINYPKIIILNKNSWIRPAA